MDTGIISYFRMTEDPVLPECVDMGNSQKGMSLFEVPLSSPSSLHRRGFSSSEDEDVYSVSFLKDADHVLLDGFTRYNVHLKDVNSHVLFLFGFAFINLL